VEGGEYQPPIEHLHCPPRFDLAANARKVSLQHTPLLAAGWPAKPLSPGAVEIVLAPPEIARRNDENPLVSAQREQFSVAGDDAGALTGDAGAQDRKIVFGGSGARLVTEVRS